MIPQRLCTISGERYFFELARIINSEVAEKLNPERRRPEGGFFYDQEEPFLDVVRSKRAKTYTTEGTPIDLVLHFDLRQGTAAAVERLIQRNQTLLDSLTTAGPFKRVWISDEYTKQVIWKSSRDLEIALTAMDRHVPPQSAQPTPEDLQGRSRFSQSGDRCGATSEMTWFN